MEYEGRSPCRFCVFRRGKSYSSFLSTTKRDPLNVLSYVEQKVSEKAEKQCCKKDIT